jgi:uncharacterized protein YdaU (DUF1376 family)
MGMVVYAYNLSYSGGRGRRIESTRTDWARLARLSQKQNKGVSKIVIYYFDSVNKKSQQHRRDYILKTERKEEHWQQRKAANSSKPALNTLSQGKPESPGDRLTVLATHLLEAVHPALGFGGKAG